MIDFGDYVSCPVCDGKARVVHVSQDGKQCVAKCSQRHTCGSRSVRGLCFLVDCSEVSKIKPYLSKLRKLVGLKLARNSDG